MNILPNNVGWILPPRCAARYTMGVLWRYGVEKLSYHDLNPDADVDYIVMNIRNPFSRIRSWLRLWNTTLQEPISAKEYIENLHYNHHGVSWVNKIENPNGKHLPWKYLTPMSEYLRVLGTHNRKPDAFVRLEHLEDDMASIGYPTQGYDYAKEPPPTESAASNNMKFAISPKDTLWEPGDGQEDKEFYLENPHCADIIATYYAFDFEAFGYSLNIDCITD